jgi:DNA polymerase III subunit alpha
MTSSSNSFVHLHNHTDYSLLHGAMRVSDVVSFAADDEMPAIALTDLGNLFGAVEFSAKAEDKGIKAIQGMEAFVVSDLEEYRTAHHGAVHQLVLLAQTARGWKNLMKVASLGYLDGLDRGRPLVDMRLLRDHADGLIALSGGEQGELTRALADGDRGRAVEVAQRFRDLFGAENFYIEIQNHGTPRESRVRELAAEISVEIGVGLVATNHCHYRRRENADAHDVLLAIAAGQTVDDPTREKFDSDQYYLKSTTEMRSLFADFPDAIENTLRIAERCDVKLERTAVLPAFELPSPFETPEDYLAHLAHEGAVKRYGEIDERLSQRLEYELDIIAKTGYAGYFLIVGDFVQVAKDRGIPVGPGRGSAAGSLVCYCVEITDVDPMEHDLLFERFLNPERVSMPDIDIDFCFEQRGAIIDYVVEKYGSQCVCQIITFGSMLARGVIRDVGRALGMGYSEVDRIAKLIPDELGITLQQALEKSAELRAVREEDPRYDRLIHTALELEGLKRHSSIHAAGILIAPGDLTENVPLYKSAKNELTTQWDMNRVEAMGLLKMDFLGLRTLTVIDKALKWVPELGGPELTASEIPMDDPSVYESLGRGDTVGIFQLESTGMQEILRKLQPSGFDDITAVNALYRPGPLGAGMVDDFIDCKHGTKEIEYPHPMLEDVLKETYGVILYQEQVMRIAGDMAGYTLGDADKLRRAMGKKKVEEMAQHELTFVLGAGERGVEQKTAKRIFDLMAYFAGYGFNKSHSASYAVLAIQTAWLKVHWPSAFMASALSSEINNTDRVVTLINECLRSGLAVHPPDVNASQAAFIPLPDGIRFGLGAVKNAGMAAVQSIVLARDELGRPFRSLFEFCERLDMSRVNRRVLEALILAGALDSMPGRREEKIAGLDLAISRAQQRRKDRERGQASLFGGIEDNQVGDGVLPKVAAWTSRERLTREREATGLYLSGHPLDDDREILEWMAPHSTRGLGQAPPDEDRILVGVITARKIITSRRSGKLVAFLTLNDLDGATEFIAFGEAYEKSRLALQSDDPLVIVGRTTRRENDDETKLILEKAYTLDQACERLVQEVHAHLPAQITAEQTEELLAAVTEHPGRRPLYLELRDGDFEAEVWAQRAAIAPVPDLLKRFLRTLGREAVHCQVLPVARLAGESKGRRRFSRRIAKESA